MILNISKYVVFQGNFESAIESKPNIINKKNIYLDRQAESTYDNALVISKWIKENTPRKQLMELVMRGDQADGVPNVLSADNVFTDGIRQPPLRQKQLDLLIDDPKSLGEDIYRNYCRNRKLIDLEEAPEDIKREIMYIRDEDKWQKDDTDQKIEDGIKEVSRKSIGSLLKWKQENPEYSNVDSDFSNKCIEIQQQSSAGVNSDNLYPKVITNLAKENKISKEQLKSKQ